MLLKLFYYFTLSLCLVQWSFAYTLSNKTFPKHFIFGDGSASYQIEGGVNEDGRSFAYTLSNKTFPKHFIFGAGSASYQIEGGVNEDGRGESIWDVSLHQNGHKTADGNNADVACDSYHKYLEDIALIKELGLNYYRISISWPRILPNGTVNNINQKGIDYYVNLLKGLQDAGIDVFVTLYHWDLPQHLQDLGGWTNPDIADYFEDFARLAYKSFGQYVKYWGTINEPSSFCIMGYGQGLNAPNLVMIGDGVYVCIYNVLRAHARAYHVYDEEFKATQNGKISMVISSLFAEPTSTSEADIAAADREMQWQTGIYAHPIYVGDWPPVVKETVKNRSEAEGYSRSRLPEFTAEEIAYINGTFDFFALNWYTGYMVNNVDSCGISKTEPSYWNDQCVNSFQDDSWPASVSWWLKSWPEGFRGLLSWIQTNYNPGDIIITENGWSDYGDLNDTSRIQYVQDHLSVILDAIYEDNVSVAGYTVWALMDNFEWMQGYSERFGIIHVDFDSPNRTRTIKESGKWYKNIISTRCLAASCSPAEL